MYKKMGLSHKNVKIWGLLKVVSPVQKNPPIFSGHLIFFSDIHPCRTTIFSAVNRWCWEFIMSQEGNILVEGQQVFGSLVVKVFNN